MKEFQKFKTIKLLSLFLVILLSITTNSNLGVKYTHSFSINLIYNAEPIQMDYILIAQNWTFIEENVLANSTAFDFEWSSDISVQGREVSETDFTTLLAMDLTDRASYFETLTFDEGIFFTGRITSSEIGKIFFVFFNPNVSDADLSMTFKINESGLKPWVIGLISTIIAIIFLIIIIWAAAKIRRKMIDETLEEEELSPEQQYMQM
ncbi:MAG: hypothetical protein EAX90_13255 [Candidatus Heimdallarchaeota archaeon]|nr:hypothetical protein [Candidatus Heimdallarchaeota archaeon]